MKQKLFLLGFMMILCVSLSYAQRPEKCGMQQVHAALIAKNPSWAERLKDQKNSLQAAADYYKQYQEMQGYERTTATVSAVPVIFHIIVDSAQFNNLGGITGIIKRCDSQIAVLNHDFNRQNSDSSSIPSSWKSLYGTPGIKFGLARKDPSGNCSPGYEIMIISGTSLTAVGFSDVNQSFTSAKNAPTGLPSWDVSKYYNVWCINFTGSASSLLGLTVPLSSTGFGGFATGDEGVCILYNTLGSTGPTGSCPGTGNWPHPYNLGRTLTHETGHFFEIWHPWGDDGGLCPWNGGADDGLTDTPPEADAVYGNPAYTITGGTYNDACQLHGATNTQPIGIACLSYMDYTDDNAMHLFTSNQAAAMASMVLVPSTGAAGVTGSGSVGENYNLTQNPSLLLCPTGVAISPVEVNSILSIYPNPTTGELNISVNATAETLNEIVIMNIMGQEVMKVKGEGKDYYTLNISGMNKGIYVVRCNFTSGSVTRKIVLE